MKNESFAFESKPRATVAPPPLESLIESEHIESGPLSEIVENPACVEQIHLRTSISNALESVVKLSIDPQQTIEQIRASAQAEEVPLCALYDSLTEFLKSDVMHTRLVLYFPFELLPDLSNIESFTVPERDSAHAFLAAYTAAWRALLTTAELRADYADGDIPEQEYRTGTLPKVVKVAHLIPQLLKRHVLSIDEVVDIFVAVDAITLQNSIADALFVAHEQGLLPADALIRMKSSENIFVANTARLIDLETKSTVRTEGETEKDSSQLLAEMESELAHFENEHAATSMSEARRAWLQTTTYETVLEKYAPQIHKQSEIDALCASDAAMPVSLGIRAIEYYIRVHDDHETQKALCEHYVPVLEEALTHTQESVCEATKTTFYHLHSLGLVHDDFLRSCGLELPQLNASSETILGGMQPEIQKFTDATERIKNNESLAQLVYPVLIFLGSRMKGYATHAADFDVAVFVRPEVSESSREELQKQLAQILTDTPAQGSAMEFWLEEKKDGTYTVKNYENPDSKRGDNTLVHPLIGAWCGDTKTVAELQEKLIPQYFYSEGTTVLDTDARSLWLKEIEHTTLKYRLMHKGYRRFNAPYTEKLTPHSDLIDGTSAFYDSGYRRLATELFLKRVFLPQLTKE